MRAIPELVIFPRDVARENKRMIIMPFDVGPTCTLTMRSDLRRERPPQPKQFWRSLPQYRRRF